MAVVSWMFTGRLHKMSRLQLLLVLPSLPFFLTFLWERERRKRIPALSEDSDIVRTFHQSDLSSLVFSGSLSSSSSFHYPMEEEGEESP